MSLEEERRLFFVGITRAKDHLQISYAKNRGFAGSRGSGVPSCFLMELPREEMNLVDLTSSYSSFEGGHGGDEWDEWNQDQPYSDTNSVDFEFDDCQLPPEEIQARLNKPKSGLPDFPAAVMLGSDLEAAQKKRDVYNVGSVVSHGKFGAGEIVATSGQGPKKSVTINFFEDSSMRTFRLSHVELKLES